MHLGLVIFLIGFSMLALILAVAASKRLMNDIKMGRI